MAVGLTDPTAPDARTADWTEITRSFQIALDPRKLLLAAAGVLAMSLGWWLLSLAFEPRLPDPKADRYQPTVISTELVNKKRADGADYTEADYAIESQKRLDSDLARYRAMARARRPQRQPPRPPVGRVPRPQPVQRRHRHRRRQLRHRRQDRRRLRQRDLAHADRADSQALPPRAQNPRRGPRILGPLLPALVPDLDRRRLGVLRRRHHPHRRGATRRPRPRHAFTSRPLRRQPLLELRRQPARCPSASSRSSSS